MVKFIVASHWLTFLRHNQSQTLLLGSFYEEKYKIKLWSVPLMIVCFSGLGGMQDSFKVIKILFGEVV